ncbi:helix-turn-helix domain-containing protein [Trichocoleus sp. ST-U3]|uniref:helix-turn-helix domain-containing protein n=1 Tax=Coleofasciculus sp. FACHB-542 TaxID=2692787 RepID=UPI0016854235|nr:helix-turn-helix domain-containing protein [Coleofasciculus sp. FACHB-542]MBD2084263.1 helix-turn-helix domain-containing protein [Coleofasciculus sp. FACHB-542]
MDHEATRQRFATRLRNIREEKGITQEQLAEFIGKTTEHVSFLERGERSPSFEVILDLADALGVPVSHLMNIDQPDDNTDLIATLIAAPVPSSLVEPVEEPITTENERQSNLDRLQSAFEGIQEMQQLANEYGITDIFQDNGGKVLQVLILLGLRISPGREGNDATDAEGNEYELKTINRALNKNAGVTTHHHLNKEILKKYRSVQAWYIAIYESINLMEIYKVLPSTLELKFKEWEVKLEKQESINNPKIPMKLVRQGELVYTNRNSPPRQTELPL